MKPARDGTRAAARVRVDAQAGDAVRSAHARLDHDHAGRVLVKLTSVTETSRRALSDSALRKCGASGRGFRAG